MFMRILVWDLVRNQLFRPWLAVNAICFSSLVKKTAWQLGDDCLAVEAFIPIYQIW